MSQVHGPDGRVWQIQRRPDASGAAGYLVPGPWRVDATTDDERRRWLAAGWRASSGLRADVALALRTGADGPPGEVMVTEDDTSGSEGEDGGTGHGVG